MSLKPAKKKDLMRPGMKPYESGNLSSLSKNQKSDHKIPIWPEWSDGDIATEKWDNGGKGKDKDKGKGSGSVPFEDPEGKIELPASLKSSFHSWKRPIDYLQSAIQEKIWPTVVDPESATGFDLVSSNEHIMDSEVMRWIICQLSTLWKIQNASFSETEMSQPLNVPGTWRPWEFIYPREKSKTSHMPIYNPGGKYCIKLFWLGSWRKVTVDDYLPFDERGRMLLPATSRPHELWPALLTKALLKVASLDYQCGDPAMEFGDFSPIQCLTGWLPEHIPITSESSDRIWDLLKSVLPNWKPPSPATDTPAEAALAQPGPIIPQPVIVMDKPTPKGKRGEGKSNPGNLNNSNNFDMTNIGNSKSDSPHLAIFASYSSCSKEPLRQCDQEALATACEKLQEHNLPNKLAHVVHLSQTRGYPLIIPPPPAPIPRFKLIRKVKKDPEEEDESAKSPPRYVEVTSLLAHYDETKVIDRSQGDFAKQNNEETIEECEDTTGNDLNKKKMKKKEQIKELQMDKQGKKQKQQQNITNYEKATEKQQKQMLTVDKPLTKANLNALDKSNKKDGIRKRINTLNRVNNEEGTEKAISECESTMVDSLSRCEDEGDGDGKEDEKSNEDEAIKKQFWMSFEDFYKSFRSLIIYHKSNSYANSKWKADYKHLTTITHTSRKTAGSAAQIVDSLKPIELLFCFTSVSRWREIVIQSRHGRRESGSNHPTPVTSEAAANSQIANALSGNHIHPGLLVAEPYTWKSLEVGEAILRLRTTGTKAVLLPLPAGRHLLRLSMQAPLGYYLQICSMTPFILGDEDVVMSCLNKESLRFMAHASQRLEGVSEAVTNLDNEEMFGKAVQKMELGEQYPKIAQVMHFTGYARAFIYHLKELISEVTPAIKFAIKALILKILLHRNIGVAIESLDSIHSISDEYISYYKGSEETNISNATSEYPLEERISNKEINGVIKFQALFRGHHVRKLLKAIKPDSADYDKIKEIILRTWSKIDQSKYEFISTRILRTVLMLEPDLYPSLPFYKDEMYHMVYHDYSGSYAEQPSKTWFVVFREVFRVQESVLMIPKLTIPLQSCHLRVVNNDNGEELPRVFQHVAPSPLKKNKTGYTIVADAKTPDDGNAPAGKWRMRLIGSNQPLPVPYRDFFSTVSLTTKEIQDYYCPNKEGIFLRYAVKVRDDLLTSLQIGTSNSNAYIELQVLDNDEEVIKSTGRGHVVIPAFTFHTDFDNRKKMESRPQSSRHGSAKGRHRNPQPSAQSSTATPSKKSRPSRPSSSSSSSSNKEISAVAAIPEENKIEDNPEDRKAHKYIIQARVLRDSWKLNSTEQLFVDTLKISDRSDAIAKDRPNSSEKHEKSETQKPSKRKNKSHDDKHSKHDKDGGSRSNKSRSNVPKSQSQQTKLRYLQTENIEIKRDTERQDEIQSLKNAWEVAEPGRSEKAKLMRQKFIEEFGIPEDIIEIAEVTNELRKEDSISSIRHRGSVIEVEKSKSPIPSPKIQRKVTLKPIDFGEHTLKAENESSLLLEDIEDSRHLLQQKTIHDYRKRREEVLYRRKEDKQSRSVTKESQLQTAIELQGNLDKIRYEIKKPRETYRQKYLEAERAKAEAAAAAAAKAEEKTRTISPPKKKKGKEKSPSPSKRKK
ncbi:uncharacterized protein TRIADDRAFT_56318 [Trichoplax adhaerens]|uniref:Uncharacterized protein n=1 Tax=Trichoplax adhaerens TaxID=10228 RepID=B3RXT0_TRIAD|nr:hypothetical protein TRIADDRAFT_56318 [Trichoplax adhaerens]EDV24483.1 hypothetical protein TRIADDRAFT_56318 [Trichoplax adhaerens]|eukprot:XP_002112373.1 hypothetical protein TRIADDRAFT_56318 [Trichoplax adhaerens]